MFRFSQSVQSMESCIDVMILLKTSRQQLFICYFYPFSIRATLYFADSKRGSLWAPSRTYLIPSQIVGFFPILDLKIIHLQMLNEEL